MQRDVEWWQDAVLGLCKEALRCMTISRYECWWFSGARFLARASWLLACIQHATQLGLFVCDTVCHRECTAVGAAHTHAVMAHAPAEAIYVLHE